MKCILKKDFVYIFLWKVLVLVLGYLRTRLLDSIQYQIAQVYLYSSATLVSATLVSTPLVSTRKDMIFDSKVLHGRRSFVLTLYC